jgi:hypothetical protein
MLDVSTSIDPTGNRALSGKIVFPHTLGRDVTFMTETNLPTAALCARHAGYTRRRQAGNIFYALTTSDEYAANCRPMVRTETHQR